MCLPLTEDCVRFWDVRLLAAVGVGGALGALFRYALSYALIDSERIFPPPFDFPFAMFCANVLGAFLLGATVMLATHLPAETVSWFRRLVMVGFLGSLTTFSTLIYEVVFLWSRSPWTAGVYVVATFGCGLVAFMIGVAGARAIWAGA